MITILRMLFPALEPMTSASIVGLVLATTAAVAFLIGLARRRRSYWWLPMAIPAVGLSAIALASWAGVRMFAAVLKTMAADGGGIATVSAGIYESAELLSTAAWIGLISSLVAAMFLRPAAGADTAAGARPGAFGLLMMVGLTIGLAPLFAVRPAIAFFLRAITPGTATPAAHLMQHLLVYEVVSAACFVIAVGVIVAMARLARRSSASQAVSFLMTVALLATVAVSAYFAARLRDTSIRFREVAVYGRVSALEPVR